MLTVSKTYLENLRKESDRVIELLSECIVIANYLRHIAVDGNENEIDEVIKLIEEETVIFNSISSTIGRIHSLHDASWSEDEVESFTVREISSMTDGSFRSILNNRCIIISKLVDAVRVLFENNEKLFLSLTAMFESLDRRISGQDGRSGKYSESIKQCVENYLENENPDCLGNRIDINLNPARDLSHDGYYFNWKKNPLIKTAEASGGGAGTASPANHRVETGDPGRASSPTTDFSTISFAYKAAADASGAVAAVLDDVVECFGTEDI